MSRDGSTRRREPVIVRACRKLTRRYQLGTAFGAIVGPRWRRVEVTLHDVAHGFTFGLDTKDPEMSEHVGARHDRMSAKHSDQAEIETCALEAIILDRFKVPVSTRMLAVTASKMMKTEKYDDWEAIERDVTAAMKLDHVRELAWCMERFLRAEGR